MSTKFYVLAILLAAVPAFSSCDKADPAYGGEIDRTVTLFGEEITVPLGTVAPITLQDALNRVGPLAELIKTDDEGCLVLEGKNKIASWSYSDIAAQAAGEEAFVFMAEEERAGLPFLLSMLTMFGIELPDQHYTLTVENPLGVSVPMSVTASVVDGYDEALQSVVLKDFEIPSRSRPETFAEFDLPGTYDPAPSDVVLDKVWLWMPENLLDAWSDNLDSDFVFSYRFRSHLGLGERLDFPFTYPLSLHLETARFALHEATVRLEVESTLPVEATVEHITLLGADGEEDPNVTFSENVTIAGGSPEHPVTTPLTLTVRAAEGTIPDIHGLRLNLRFAAAPGFGTAPVSAAQGLSVRSSSFTLRGGITLPIGNHEK